MGTFQAPNPLIRNRSAGQVPIIVGFPYWMSDILHGPRAGCDSADRRKRAKTYLIGFLDDATRLVPHASFAFSENSASFLPVFKQALLKRGIPTRLYVEYVPRHIFDAMCPLSLCAHRAAMR